MKWLYWHIMMLQGNTSPKWKGWLRRLLSGTTRPRWFSFATGEIQIHTKYTHFKDKYKGGFGIGIVFDICHSMGSIMMHYFLQQQSPAWKEKHIRWWGDASWWQRCITLQMMILNLIMIMKQHWWWSSFPEPWFLWPVFGEALLGLSKSLLLETTSTHGQFYTEDKIWRTNMRKTTDKLTRINLGGWWLLGHEWGLHCAVIISIFSILILIQVPELEEPALGANQPKSCLADASTRILVGWWGPNHDYDDLYDDANDDDDYVDKSVVDFIVVGVGGDGEEELHPDKHRRVLWRIQRAQHGHDGQWYKGSSLALASPSPSPASTPSPASGALLPLAA